MTHEPMGRLRQWGQPEGSFLSMVDPLPANWNRPRSGTHQAMAEACGHWQGGLSVSEGLPHLRLNQ